MKYRLIELKDKEGNICYRIQKRNFLYIWRNVRTTKVYKNWVDWICSAKVVRNFYSKEFALDVIKRLNPKYTEYRGYCIYPTISDNIFYVPKCAKIRFSSSCSDIGETVYHNLVYGSYKECCDGIDKWIESNGYKRIINI